VRKDRPRPAPTRCRPPNASGQADDAAKLRIRELAADWSIEVTRATAGKHAALADLVAALARPRGRDPRCRIERLHFYSFGDLTRTAHAAR
jgi:hypothetical protein